MSNSFQSLRGYQEKYGKKYMKKIVEKTFFYVYDCRNLILKISELLPNYQFNLIGFYNFIQYLV